MVYFVHLCTQSSLTVHVYLCFFHVSTVAGRSLVLPVPHFLSRGLLTSDRYSFQPARFISFPPQPDPPIVALTTQPWTQRFIKRYQ